jgi:putative transcriptional regulator
MKSANTTKTTPKRPKLAKTDWSRFDAMTEAQRHRAAVDDPDAQPLSPADLKLMKRTPQVKIIRRALGFSQDDFAARFQIPIGTLRDWEQGRATPDQAARAYLKVIARDPEAVHKALSAPLYRHSPRTLKARCRRTQHEGVAR